MYANIFMSIYVLKFFPFELRDLNIIEIFNEIIIYLLMSLNAVFTDYCNDP